MMMMLAVCVILLVVVQVMSWVLFFILFSGVCSSPHTPHRTGVSPPTPRKFALNPMAAVCTVLRVQSVGGGWVLSFFIGRTLNTSI